MTDVYHSNLEVDVEEPRKKLHDGEKQVWRNQIPGGPPLKSFLALVHSRRVTIQWKVLREKLNSC